MPSMTFTFGFASNIVSGCIKAVGRVDGVVLGDNFDIGRNPLKTFPKALTPLLPPSCLLIAQDGHFGLSIKVLVDPLPGVFSRSVAIRKLGITDCRILVLKLFAVGDPLNPRLPSLLGDRLKDGRLRDHATITATFCWIHVLRELICLLRSVPGSSTITV